MADDAELIAQARQGDEVALEQLLTRYESMVYSYLFRMLGNVHEAEDAIQETFIRVVKGLGRYRESGRFVSWLLRTAHREGLRVIKKRKRISSHEVSPDEEFATAPEPVDQQANAMESLMSKERMQELAGMLDRLPGAEREVIVLRVIQGLTFQEIADAMACPLGTALGRMRNATRRLRDMLAEN
ncbi:MAG: RNA polymerase sigma factor [Verrucomicrobiota bacterium]